MSVDNTLCVPDSVAAGIVDKSGGIRVVITPKSQLQYHLGEGEKLYVVPGFTVAHPIPIERYPALVEKVIRYVQDHAD